MSTSALLAVLTGSVAILTNVAAGPLTTNDLAQSRIAATNSLERFRRLLTPENCTIHGFNSTNDAATAVLGDAIPLGKFNTKRLTNYLSPQTFKGLVEPVPEVIYPIMVSNAPVSSTRLRLSHKKWEVADWGRPNTIRDLSSLRTDSVNDPGMRGRLPTDVFAVLTPICGWWMVGFDQANGIPVLRTSAPILSSPGTNHIVTTQEIQELARRMNAYSGGSD